MGAGDEGAQRGGAALWLRLVRIGALPAPDEAALDHHDLATGPLQVGGNLLRIHTLSARAGTAQPGQSQRATARYSECLGVLLHGRTPDSSHTFLINRGTLYRSNERQRPRDVTVNRLKRILASGGVAVLVAGATMLATAGAASATPGLSCDGLQAMYDMHMGQANTFRVIGDVYASEGSYWVAESYFAQSRNEWINAMNIQLC
jgi:hypothetical protein